MCSNQDGELLLAETAASAGATSERAQALLEVLRRVVPFDAAWIALADPFRSSYSSLASADLDDRVVDLLRDGDRPACGLVAACGPAAFVGGLPGL